MLCRIGGVDVGGAGVGPHSEQSKPTGGLELGVECELVLPFGDPIRIGPRAGKVAVVATTIEAGAHDRDVRRWKRRVQDERGTGFLDYTGNGDSVSGIQTDSRDPGIIEPVR